MAIAALLGAAYPALALVVEAHPDIAERLAEEGFQTARDRATYLTRLRARIGADDGVGWDVDVTRRELRRFARDERIRVALREALPASAGGADVDVTSAELGALADATIEVALEEAQHAVSARFGVPVTASGGDGRFVVLGMGKLGGDELNAGSDVDLIYFYDTDDGEVVPRIQEAGEGISGVGGEERGATRTRPRSSMPPVGDGGITLHDYWSRVAKRLTATLEEVTEDGFVWRVDLRLRPEGRSGPIVNSLAAAERYYESFGRLWERAALLRARPVAGSLALGDEFLRDLAPFVWRKRVSPQVATDMIALVHRARAELSHDADRDLKLGPGGIREAEFFVQSLQLIWGGVEVRARAQGTLDGLRRLRALGYVTDREGREIAEGYLALRRAEHAVQSATGVQTHALPASGEEMERLARLLRFKGQGAFLTELAAHRARIAARFLSLLPQGSQPPSRWVEAAAALDRGDREGFIEALARDAGHLLKETTYGSDLELPDRFRDLGNDLFELGRHPDGLLGARTRESFSRLPEILLDAVMDAADAEQAARYLRIYSVRLRVPGVYTSMLGADPRLLRRLIEALGSSAFIGDALVGNPDLADFVLFARGAPTPEVIRRSIETALGEEPPDLDPEEAVVGALRRARARVTIDVGLADLSGEMDTRATTLALSTLADATLEVATRFALGTPPGEPVRGLCVVAMGKLGGRELGYGSDLDVFFLFDPTRAAPGSPGAGMDPDTYFARCARRIIRLISVSHGAGPGYELDTRLRPSGSQGMLVTSLEGFARYHGIRKAGSAADPERRVGVRAAAWERLALLRARPAAGDMEIGAEAMGIAEQAAYGQVEDFRRTVEEIHRLRGRMERELSNERRGRRDLKMGRGGLVDIEFAVQLLQMRHGADPSVRTQETPAAIDALAEGGYLSPAQAETLRDGYGFLRKLDQRSRVVNADPSHLLESGGPGVPSLARRMGIRGRTAAETAAELFARYAEITERVRAAYEDIVARLLVQEAPSGGVLDPRASSGGVG
ncbi:bifunctional [glutamate--ammonia ligase]-adenylyl-L-tyrosine phosphorylase/[glutamate--ammonia-ligase] adenylyltransferase [Chondromyces apiculatus]|uniref:Glutamate-ammonia-ligase adenylyltransferase n=1 Tax=Chondromyces apiculatus DSM 436 TaxID=1192034 RepID=A0A017SZ63_9BACT|nr:bifunctional [glutamate--ammonia ligase]-adenylyl-L-tyrosine phosphorylase/[glutamate--ammonia-ligase] adenylyltransferase [Chondromyces apiculatus]EYF01561.1 Glutamate-ammonia-ligase adenylyltransferase [Chondromyces apiculatus DSM 436]